MKKIKRTLQYFPQPSQQLPPVHPPGLPPVPGGCQHLKKSSRDRVHSKAGGVLRTLGLEEERPSRCYDPEYLEHCYADEPKAAINWTYLSTVQVDVDSHKRLVLIDWLVEVSDEFRLGQSTLFLAANLVDRYLGARPVPRSLLQLLGAAALWLACKFEEVYPPTLGDFVDVTQGSCSGRQLIDMEASLLRDLGFTLMVPTAVTFLALFLPAAAANAADADAYLAAAVEPNGDDSDDSAEARSSGGGAKGGRRLLRADAPTGPRAAPCYPYPVGSPCSAGGYGFCSNSSSGAKGGALFVGARAAAGPAVANAASLGDFPRRVAHLAEYLSELSLLTPECLRFPPSLVAAASISLACSLLGAPPGTRARLAPAAEAAAARAGPGGEELLGACVVELRRMFVYAARAPRPPSVKYKYCSAKRGAVAALPVPRWALEA